MNNLSKRWCDLKCRYSQWPEVTALDGSNSCRTFIALYCRKAGKIVAKNGPCLFKEKEAGK